jgi:NAD(P)-dependent dehydrogenase (short-subunit alcohol dehydrogenase family)
MNIIWPVRQVLFSSIAALLGAPGQANYCAANVALDAMAVSAQAAGAAVVSVQWGAWAVAGMAVNVRQIYVTYIYSDRWYCSEHATRHTERKAQAWRRTDLGDPCRMQAQQPACAAWAWGC